VKQKRYKTATSASGVQRYEKQEVKRGEWQVRGGRARLYTGERQAVAAVVVQTAKTRTAGESQQNPRRNGSSSATEWWQQIGEVADGEVDRQA